MLGVGRGGFGGGGCGFGSGLGCWLGCGLRWGKGRSANYGGLLDYVELGVVFVEEGFALFLDGVLLVGGAFGVLIEEHFDDLHAIVVDGGEGSEAHGIQANIAVREIDEDLRGAGVGAGGGEGDVAALVGLQDGIVLDGGVFPGGVDGRIGTDAELNDEALDGAEDDHVVVIVVTDEIVEAVDAERSPGAGDVHGEVAASGFKFCLKGVGSLFLEERGLEEGAVVGGSGGLGFGGGGGFGFGGDLGCGVGLGMGGIAENQESGEEENGFRVAHDSEDLRK